MKENIRQLIEYYGFNPADIKDNRPKSKLSTQDVKDSLTIYVPNTKEDLHEAIIRVGMKDHVNTWTDNKHCLDLNCIDVSNIKDFSGIFKNFKKTIFWKFYNNVDVSLWDVSNGTNFNEMFSHFTTFNCDLSGWDVSNGETFNRMFMGCSKFNSDISSWNVENAVSFNEMFRGCSKFNQNLNKWKPIKCKDYIKMFYNCYAFSHRLDSWWRLHDFYHDEKLYTIDMFFGCESFNYPKWYEDSIAIHDWLSGKSISFIKREF